MNLVQIIFEGFRDGCISSTNDFNQHLRLRRFAIAVVTYCMDMLALYLITCLGLGTLSPEEWAIIVSLCLAGNALFFLMFITGCNRHFPDPSLTREQIIFAAFWAMVNVWVLPEVRPVVLMFFLPAVGFGMLRLYLKQYMVIVGWTMAFYSLLLVVEYITKGPLFRLDYELFLFGLFGILLFWEALFGGFISNLRRKLKHRNREIQKAHRNLKKEVEIRKRAEKEKDLLILDLQKALKDVKTLSGLLPICASCKKIRDDKGYWNQIEMYISRHSDAQFSHGICPDCWKELYPELEWKESFEK